MAPKVISLDGLYNGYNLLDARQKAVSAHSNWRTVMNASFLLSLASPLSTINLP